MSSNTRFEPTLRNDRILIEEALEDILSEREKDRYLDASFLNYENDALLSSVCSPDLTEGLKYALLNGGKRLRAIIALEFCRICGNSVKNAIPFACAVEMIHAYSLVHDDMPCMDDDELRRGKPSCHKKYGEATALLIGDALLTLAFETIARSSEIHLTTEAIVAAVKALSEYSGFGGMVGGQSFDMEYEGKEIDLQSIETMYGGKTCALFMAAARLGCIASYADKDKTLAAVSYAKQLGMAFQLEDDLLDLTGDESVLGKPIHSDEQNNKMTYAAVAGIENTRAAIEKYTEAALKALEAFPEEKRDFFVSLAEELISRNK